MAVFLIITRLRTLLDTGGKNKKSRHTSLYDDSFLKKHIACPLKR